MKDTSSKNRLWIVILAGAIGLFLIIGAPLLVQLSLERDLIELLEVVKDRPQFSSGMSLFSLFYPLWRALGFVAGIVLLVITPSIYKGEEWTFPAALAAFSIAAIGGMFMFLPYISWVGDFPVPMVISWVGLLGFWGIIFLRQTERIEMGSVLLPHFHWYAVNSRFYYRHRGTTYAADTSGYTFVCRFRDVDSYLGW